MARESASVLKETAQLIENVVKVEPVGEFELKGLRWPMAAYNVIAAAS
jgi:hypothetical protein